tara:strand:+ start:154 stop:2169 length:2016 start_codon:yes stop_codon:yes gene_type:complete
MAKKTGGLNLNPGADSSIVASATKAAMAAKPVDLSKQFGMIAQGYSQQMAAFGKIGAQLGAVAGQLALPLIDKAVDNIRFQAGKVGTTPDDIDPTMVSDLEKMVDNIKGVIKGDVNSDLVKEEWDTIFPELKGKYEETDLSALDESQIKKIKNYGKNLKNKWINSANNYRAGNMRSDFNAANMSPYMKKGYNNDQLLFSLAGSLNGAPIGTDSIGKYALSEEFEGVQRRPVIKNGEIQYGLYKEVGGELKEVAGVDKHGSIQFVGEGFHGKSHYVRNVDQFNEGWVVESQFRSVFNEPYQSVVNNALKGIEFDPEALKSSLLMAKTEDGHALTTNDVKDLSMVQVMGTSQTYDNYLTTINAETAKAYLEADPNWRSRLTDITGDNEIKWGEDYLPTKDFDEYKDTFPNAYANSIRTLQSDPNAFVDFVVSELEKTHNKYAPPTSTGNTNATPPVKLTQTERNSKAFINKILTNQPSVSLGSGYPTWQSSAVDLGHDDMTPFYHTPLVDENGLVIGYDIKTVYELNADFGGSQALGWDEETFGPVARFDAQTKKKIENELLSQNPDYQAKIKQEEEKVFATEKETFIQNVFSNHPKFTEGDIGTNQKHEQQAVNFFATRYPGITYQTKRDGVDKIFASFGNQSTIINLDIEDYSNELKAFETWYENNKPIIE